MTDAPGLVGRYLGAVGAGDVAAVSDLFAVDAVFHHPAGTARGRAEISAFYTGVFAAGGLPVQAGRAFASGRDVLFEICAPGDDPDEPPRAMDHATLDDDGRIVRLVAMGRPLPK